jgi:hypothetical protein
MNISIQEEKTLYLIKVAFNIMVFSLCVRSELTLLCLSGFLSLINHYSTQDQDCSSNILPIFVDIQ